MPFNIVLVEPEIPNNTGNIGRTELGLGVSVAFGETVWV